MSVSKFIFTKRSEKKVVFFSQWYEVSVSRPFLPQISAFSHRETNGLLFLLKEAKRRRRKRCCSERSRSRLSAGGGGGGGALKRRVGVGVVVKRD